MLKIYIFVKQYFTREEALSAHNGQKLKKNCGQNSATFELNIKGYDFKLSQETYLD